MCPLSKSVQLKVDGKHKDSQHTYQDQYNQAKCLCNLFHFLFEMRKLTLLPSCTFESAQLRGYISVSLPRLYSGFLGFIHEVLYVQSFSQTPVQYHYDWKALYINAQMLLALSCLHHRCCGLHVLPASACFCYLCLLKNLLSNLTGD